MKTPTIDDKALESITRAVANAAGDPFSRLPLKPELQDALRWAAEHPYEGPKQMPVKVAPRRA